jgi:glucose/arabinose dehydrogenase
MMIWRAAVAVTMVVGVGQAVRVPAPDGTDPSVATQPIVHGLNVPSAIVFLPDGRALVTERAAGVIDVVDVDRRTAAHVAGVPPVLTGDDAGLHDIVLHPDYRTNGWLYLTYSEGNPERSTTVVDRARLKGDALVDRERIFTADAYSEDRYHYGGRLAFANGYLFVSIGDRHHEARAQELTAHAGKILRLFDDGRVPPDNPFAGVKDARGEIWSYGHRNPQGLAFNPRTGELWENEHGPLGGDELNVIEKGANYGWPVISYGWHYEGGPIGQGIVKHEGMMQPRWVWTPAIAPSGPLWYTGNRFPQWRNSILIGAMAGHQLNRLAIRDGLVVVEERLLNGIGRVRSVAQGNDGFVYLGTDAGDILRLVPPPSAM